MGPGYLVKRMAQRADGNLHRSEEIEGNDVVVLGDSRQVQLRGVRSKQDNLARGCDDFRVLFGDPRIDLGRNK